MNRQAVKSSNISSVGYDAATRTMEVEFQGGGLYQYHDVAPETHKAFMGAESLGSHFAAHIRPKHTCTKCAKEKRDDEPQR